MVKPSSSGAIREKTMHKTEAVRRRSVLKGMAAVAAAAPMPLGTAFAAPRS